MKAIRVHTPGGPEVLRYEDVPDPAAGPGDGSVDGWEAAQFVQELKGLLEQPASLFVE